MKPKILFALNYRRFEEALEQKLKNQYDFVGSAAYREVIVEKVRQTNPDIILMREAIPGTKSILDIIYTIRNTHKNVRIIFMTGRRDPGDLLLADLVSYGVYDIITSESIQMKEVLQLIREAQSFDDVSYLMPKPNRDEKNPKKAFEVQTRVVEKEVIKVVEKQPEPLTLKPEPQEVPVSKVPAPPKPIAVEPEKEEPVPLVEPEESSEPDVIEVTPEPVEEPSTVPAPPPIPEAAPLPPLPPLPPQPASDRPPLDSPLPVKGKRGNFFKGKGTKAKQPAPAPNPNVLALPAHEPEPAPTLSLPPLPPAQTVGNVQTKQILAFVGAVNGVGNTQIAFNSAVKLAQDGHKVLFIEMNPNFSTIDTSFQLGDYQRGLEKALLSISQQNQKGIEKAVIKMADIQKQTKNTSAMSKNYKRMPASLDFLLFSQDYQTLIIKPTVEYASFKDLCMLLLLQENYDYVVIDSEPFGKRPETLNDIASIASRVFVTLNQETAQIGHTTRHVLELNKRINSEDKLYYILNKEVQSECDQALIEEWLDAPMSATIPDVNQQMVDANFLGIPFLMHSAHENAHRAFHAIKTIIQHP